MSVATYKKNEDVEAASLDKMTVYQDCISGFNASPIQPRRCRALLSKLIRLMACGETFPPDEATALFFSITKLFQHKDESLRQMVYLAVKELSPTANDVIMATSSIMKDVQGSNDHIYKPNAIRALARIIDASIVQGIERLMKTSIVEKHAGISSAALVSSYHLYPIAKDIVRRWANETNEAVTDQKRFPTSPDSRFSGGGSSMTQYHALGLLYHLRSHDRMALKKMIQQFSSSNALRNPNAIVMLIRYISKAINEEPGTRTDYFELLEGWLRHKSDIVNLEAAKTILGMKNVTDQEAYNAIQSLQAFLGSPRTVAKFAAIRILNKFSMAKPELIVACNAEIERLISEPSRSIATYAITTLLKTGTEDTVDRLVSKISDFMSDISDEFKIVVIDAVRSLSLKFPHKYSSMLTFVSGTLRDEGGIKFKTAVVECLFDMIRYIPESKDAALDHLCEYIEDCEFTELTVRILHLLGVEGPKTAVPTVYIRFIYNRVVLENAVIRAAAVTSLAKFALVDDPAVKQSIKVLLTRCLDDVTDEVRDRAALSLRLLGMDKQVACAYVAPATKFKLPQLEHQLAMYVSGTEEDLNKPFDISAVPVMSKDEEEAEALRQRTRNMEEQGQGSQVSSQQQQQQQQQQQPAHAQELAREVQNEKYAKELKTIPEIAEYGQLLKSSNEVALTESEVEYVVSVVKHVFDTHLVVQYNVKNTIEDTVLENVHVEVDADYEPEFIVPIDKLATNEQGTIYVSFPLAEELEFMEINNALKFVFKEVDPSTGTPQADGYDDSYDVEPFQVVMGDFMTPAYVGDFDSQFEQLPQQDETTSKFSTKTIAQVTEEIIELLAMSAMGNTDMPSSESSHTLKLIGRTTKKQMAGCLVKMVHSAKSGTTIKVVAKGESDEVPALIVNSVDSMS